MIRGNYSLAKEVRKNELKQRQKIQQKQKHQHKLQKLQQLDPVRLYFQIQKLESSGLEGDQQTRLKQLKDDWSFIEKNNLHQEKLKPFLEEQKKKQELKRKAESKLWGKQSIYFNPELNPLGKVPDVENLSQPMEGTLPNLTTPIKSKTKYEKDPLLDTLGVVFPEGPKPQFYKNVQNTSVKRKLPEEKTDLNTKPSKKAAPNVKRTNLDSDSEAEINSEEELEYWGSKRPKSS